MPHLQQFNPFDITDSCRFVYIISPPYSGIANRLKERYTKKYSLVIKIKDSDNADFIDDNIKLIKKERAKTIILQDSESYTLEAIQIKTRLISKLKSMVSEEEIEKVLIISSTQPSFKFKVLYRADGSKEDTQKYKVYLDNYLHTIGKFKRVFYPLQNIECTSQKDSGIHTSQTFYNPEIINHKAAKNWINFQEQHTDEDRILNEQSLFQVYYFSVWHSLEDREKYLLYDLAQDGLANYRNMDIINDLIQKGILTYKNLRLDLFSASFKNFILTNIDRTESLHIELEAKRNGNWANLRLPLLMIIMALFVFLLLTQQDKVNSIFGWIATSLASLPILMRVLAGVTGIFGSKEK